MNSIMSISQTTDQLKSLAIVPKSQMTLVPPREPVYGTVIPNRIFVGGISRDTTEYDLMVVFGAYGKVRNAKVILDHLGYNKGYAFVTFETEEEARRLHAVNNCVVLRNHRLNIGPAFKKQPIYRVLQQIVDRNGNVYLTTTTTGGQGTALVPPAPSQPPPPPPPTPSASSCASMGGMQMDQFGNVTYPTALYQQAPPAVQYQPIYQYFSVPMNTVWHQNYYQDQPASGNQLPIPSQGAWEFDDINSNRSNNSNSDINSNNINNNNNDCCS